MIQRHSATLNKHLLSFHSVQDTVLSNRKSKVDETSGLLSKTLSGGAGRHTDTGPEEQHQVPEKHHGTPGYVGYFSSVRFINKINMMAFK